MDAAQIPALATEALWLSLTLAAPVLATTLVVSLATSALQSVTQVQDTALATVPRLASGLVALWLSAHWMSDRLSRFAADVFQAFAAVSS